MWIQPGTYNETTGTGVEDSDFIADEHQGILQPSEEKQILVGLEELPYIGELTTTFMSNDVSRAATSVECTPLLSISSECGGADEKSKFTISLTPSSQAMISPLNFNILEQDSSGEWQILKVKGTNDQLTTEGSFQLPQGSGDEISYIYEVDIEDEYGSPARGEYKIQFAEVQNSDHWAWDALGQGATLSCTTSACGCEGMEETHCFVFPHEEELRKTYGPGGNDAYELDGTTKRGTTPDNPNGYPQYANYPFEGTWDNLTEKPVWIGNTSRVNNDDSEGRMCGTIVGTPEELHMAFTFTILDNAAICFPKHTEEQTGSGGVSWSILIYKSRETKDEFGLPLIEMGFGDVPLDQTKLITILLGYDDVTKTFSDCFSIPVSMAKTEYFIDEELNG
jgi:hypothetical protein